MHVRYSGNFEKRFRRLPHADKKAALEVIAHFLEHPEESLSVSHVLHGSMARQRSLSVDHDLRIIFTVKGDYDEVLFLDIGTHADVYRD
jgi:addiction module RelE/StbE family toxin